MNDEPAIAPTPTSVVEHSTCLACGCLCDDIRVVVEGGQVVEAGNACPIGRAWFLAPRPGEGRPVASIDGQAAGRGRGDRPGGRDPPSGEGPGDLGPDGDHDRGRQGGPGDRRSDRGRRGPRRVVRVDGKARRLPEGRPSLRLAGRGQGSRRRRRVLGSRPARHPPPALGTLLGRARGSFHPRRTSRSVRHCRGFEADRNQPARPTCSSRSTPTARPKRSKSSGRWSKGSSLIPIASSVRPAVLRHPRRTGRATDGGPLRGLLPRADLGSTRGRHQRLRSRPSAWSAT